MSGGGYAADPAALAQAAKGINGTITELRDLGIVGTGDVGRGFSQLAMSGMDVGHDGLKDAFDEFCTRWSWGVRTLVQDGNEIAVRLGLNAGKYALMEEYAEDTMKGLFADVAGDPRMSDEDASKQSWSQLMDQTTSTDYSPESFTGAADRMGDSWADTARDTVETRSNPLSGLEDVQQALGGGDDQPAPGTTGTSKGGE